MIPISAELSAHDKQDGIKKILIGQNTAEFTVSRYNMKFWFDRRMGPLKLKFYGEYLNGACSF